MMYDQKIICIIQARMSSNRLPGKVLKDICGHPMMHWVVSRARKAKNLDDLVIATTTDPTDDLIVAWCEENKINCFRGDVFDVLDRYYQAAKNFQADVIIRLTADCPLIDPDLIDLVIDAFFENKVDFAANRLPPPYTRTYPIGLDIEVASFTALSKAWRLAHLPFEREHVMPYIYSEKGRFNIQVLDADEDQGNRRWTVDTPEDLEFIRALFNKLNCVVNFSWKEILNFLDQNPDLERINAGITHKTYRDVDNRSKF